MKILDSNMSKFLLSFFCCITMLYSCSTTDKQGADDQGFTAYLFSYFTGNGPGEEQVWYALSSDGFNYRALNNNQPVIAADTISSTGGVRDPHILRGNDGMFYMVVTDLYVPEMGWRNTAMVLLKSPDLIHWEHTVINIPETFPDEFGDVYRVWAPQTIYDEQEGKYMVYFSMKQDDDPDIIYYAYANDDFTGLETVPKQLYFPPEESKNRACIDGDIVKKDGKFYLFHKAEDGEPGIKLAISDKLTEGYELWSLERIDKETTPVEGSGTFKLIDSDEYILMYDLYIKGGYQFTKSKDLKNFEVIDEKISMNFHPRHGSVIPVTQQEVDALMSKWGTFQGAIVSSGSPQVKKNNIVLNDSAQTIYVPVKNGTDLSSFDPAFVLSPGIKFEPSAPQDFTDGPVTYTLSINDDKTRDFEATVEIANNPVVEGYYADPEIIYSEKDSKYYLYPTSDGFTGWSGYYFETFSSPDLVNWKNEGVILDLKKDVSWTDRNAWAPAAIEKKINGEYKYFYYFTAAQKVGVAVADEPTGPFVDAGAPLIDWKPEGVKGGQEIDPDVFTDPVSGKSYLYWGNGYMAVAELNDDMMSIDRSSLKVITPDKTYREGCEVFYRNGQYYFMWSEDDTRSPNYRVRYATSDSPTGPLDIPEDNLVIAKDPDKQIYGTGHNSVIKDRHSDDWYIVYHRFTRPKGISMGRAAGFHREVCIDKLTFNNDGSIIRVNPTLQGVAPLKR